ncbi:hypothetical protein HAX54_050158 [Datura stramonium]|uniref:Uncharacterized protein n=1 Tax=Datura stramonium TaxID=4076 RepID=A0ABS8SWB3_DATST|nr:hypothetical protein [Datura stramonium]
MGAIEFRSSKNYSMPIDEGIIEKCPGMSNLRVLSLTGYGINDTSFLSVLGLGTHTGLKKLEDLYLSSNGFNSTIFSSLKHLPSLKHLDLENKLILVGKIEMSGLSFVYSDLTASATTYALRNMSTLEYLEGSYLNENFLSSIGQMTSLKVLNMAFGGNYGTLPNQGWCELKNIQELAFINNNFEGTLPSCLGNLTSLRWLGLDGNHFTGNIDSYPFWRRLTSLEYLDISFNQFEVPVSLNQFLNHSKLTYLDVGYNTLTTDTGYGNFPTWLLENNTRLAGLYARHNAFTGPLKLPSSCHLYLEQLDVSTNKLSGRIPANISSVFPKLNILNMSQNLLEGPIPLDIGGFHLLGLDLSYNFLSGGVPPDLAIGSPVLNYLRLSNNKLTGHIFPKDVRPRLLYYLYLNGNSFEGPLPSNIFLKPLIALDASSNNFSGEIPRWIRGSVPSCVSGLPLEHIHLDKNQLGGDLDALFNISSLLTGSWRLIQAENDAETGSIPYYQATSRSVVRFLGLDEFNKALPFSYGFSIDLSSNRLSGEIPIELGNLSKIHALNLSHNHFIGKIPNTFSNLHEIESLDLSYNSLNGRIPVGLVELHFLAIFSVAYNNLSAAVPPSKDQFSTFDKSSYEGNPLLCGYPLDNECSGTKSSNTSNNGSEESAGFVDMESFYIGFVVSYGSILLGLVAALCFNPYWRTAWFRLIEALMLCSYYFLLDNVVTPIKNRCWRNLVR